MQVQLNDGSIYVFRNDSWVSLTNINAKKTDV